MIEDLKEHKEDKKKMFDYADCIITVAQTEELARELSEWIIGLRVAADFNSLTSADQDDVAAVWHVSGSSKHQQSAEEELGDSLEDFMEAAEASVLQVVMGAICK
jgi:hypothetical protein